MIVDLEISQEQKKVVLSQYPSVGVFLTKSITDFTKHEKEVEEYHERQVLNRGLKGWKNRKHSPATKEKIKKGLKKYFAQFKGQEYHLFEETKRRISEGNKGKIISQETRQKISKATKGKKRTEEQRERISQGLKGLKRSEETKRKIGLGHKGMKYKKHKIKELPVDMVS